jgi:hypothetical protein
MYTAIILITIVVGIITLFKLLKKQDYIPPEQTPDPVEDKPLKEIIIVKVLDESGNPLKNVNVIFKYCLPLVVDTDENGIAESCCTLIGKEYIVIVSQLNFATTIKATGITKEIIVQKQLEK